MSSRMRVKAVWVFFLLPFVGGGLLAGESGVCVVALVYSLAMPVVLGLLDMALESAENYESEEEKEERLKKYYFNRSV
jgi:hypothetical protein